MLENQESLEKCESCFSQMTYLLGYCPVCNDTGFVKKQAKEPLLWEDKDYDSHRRELSNPGEALR